MWIIGVSHAKPTQQGISDQLTSMITAHYLSSRSSPRLICEILLSSLSIPPTLSRFEANKLWSLWCGIMRGRIGQAILTANSGMGYIRMVIQRDSDGGGR